MQHKSTRMKRRQRRRQKEEIKPVSKNNHVPKGEVPQVEQNTYTVEVNERVMFTITARTKREAKRKAIDQQWNRDSRMYLEANPIIRTVTLKG